MNVLEIKGSLFDLLWGVEDAATLLKIKEFVSETINRERHAEADWWEELSAEQQAKLGRILEESKKGKNLLSHEEAMQAS